MMEQPFMVYTRNVMLVMGLAWYAHRSKGAVRAGLDDGGRRAGSISGRARQIAGFTLLETLLSVLLVGVLAALLIPQVAGVNVKTRAAKVAAAMGGHAAVLTQYGSDYREVFPYLTDPRATLNVVRSESLNIAIECYYFDPAWCWHIGLADQYYGGTIQIDLFRGRHANQHWLFPTRVMYPYSFAARPEYWDLSSRRAEPEQFSATRHSEVVFPSAKALLTESLQELPLTSRVPGPCVGFVDGHAEAVTQERMLRGGAPPNNLPNRYEYYFGSHFFEAPFLHTLDGVRGRDVR